MASRKFPVNIKENWRLLNYLLNGKKNLQSIVIQHTN